MPELLGRTSLVTGGASGLGAETCRVLAAAGSNVVVADIDGEAAGRLAATLRDCPGRAESVALDVRDAAAATAAVAEAEERFGGLDVLVNNAGVDRTVPFDELSVDDWDRVLNVNLRGAFVTRGCSRSRATWPRRSASC
jgi:NAD(P)-dependent dehydrogenase (short-subunit alcohol dehydrogenase family)